MGHKIGQIQYSGSNIIPSLKLNWINLSLLVNQNNKFMLLVWDNKQKKFSMHVLQNTVFVRGMHANCESFVMVIWGLIYHCRFRFVIGNTILFCRGFPRSLFLFGFLSVSLSRLFFLWFSLKWENSLQCNISFTE